MIPSIDAGLSGPSTSASATSSTAPVSISIGGTTTDWTLIIALLAGGILVMLFLLKRK